MKIDMDLLADIIFDESAIYPKGRETTSDESEEKFKIAWSNLAPDSKTRYITVTDSKGKSYQYRVTLSFSKGKLVK